MSSDPEGSGSSKRRFLAKAVEESREGSRGRLTPGVGLDVVAEEASCEAGGGPPIGDTGATPDTGWTIP